ncbi:hypothetical protein GQ53DRAFT_821401 [Thozetella sp. PMI_491]|nr:hypothetical protein GQ53DRAFT_821401 [Thozetella sp. PMI_491]
METETIWTLPQQRLPKIDGGVVGGAFNTIWAVVLTTQALLFYNFLHKYGSSWPEFWNVATAAAILSIWYIGAAIDRWLHYSQQKVPYGYLLLDPLLEIFRIASTIVILWATHNAIWHELQLRFDNEKTLSYWWKTAKIGIFLTSLISLFYLLLNLETTVIWLEFFSLNVIDDVASKRSNFALAMSFFFCTFALLNVTSAAVTIIFRAIRTDGSPQKDRLWLVAASIILFARYLAECVLTWEFLGPVKDTHLSKDVSYGLLTCMYLIFMYFQMWMKSSKKDTGDPCARNIQSRIRQEIIDKLRANTQDARLPSPEFMHVLDELKIDIDSILESVPSAPSSMSQGDMRDAALRYIGTLSNMYSTLGCREGTSSQGQTVSTEHLTLLKASQHKPASPINQLPINQLPIKQRLIKKLSFKQLPLKQLPIK